MNRILSTLAIVTLAVVQSFAMTVKEVPNVHLADSTRFVSDPAGYLNPDSLASADRMLHAMWGTTAEPVVVIVKDMDGVDVDSYATDLFTLWGIGKKDNDNGLLLLISMEDRKAAIRTGYGLEGSIPDIIAGRILREVLFPAMREGNVDLGVNSSLRAIGEIINDPENATEIVSRYNNNENVGADDETDFMETWLFVSVIVTLFIIWKVLRRYKRSSKIKMKYKRYEHMRETGIWILIASVIFLGLPLIPYVMVRIMTRRIRRSVLKCPQCDHDMNLIDEVHDNDYLNPTQDTEEKIGSVDYDVWECPACSYVEIHPYIKDWKDFKTCPKCGGRTAKVISDKVLVQATTRNSGSGVKTFRCSHCQNEYEKKYKIPKRTSGGGIGAIGAAAILGGRSSGGGYSGGGGGGSFGGGSTGGGGASGGW